MKKIFCLLTALFILLSFCPLKADPPANSELKYVGGINRGQKYTLGKFPVLILKGSFRDMGRQYGKLLREEIRGLYARMKTELLDRPGFPAQKSEQMARDLGSRYPERFRRLLEGVAESSGLGFDKIVLLDNLLLLAQQEDEYFQCSSLAAWGEYTGGKPLVLGRNFDFAPYFKKFEDSLALVVLKPDDGSCPTAVFGYAGQISGVHAFNVRGLGIETNLGQPGDDSQAEDRSSGLLNLTQDMLDAGNFEALKTLAASNRFFAPLLLLLVGPERAVCYEMDLNESRTRPAKGNGFLALTNHFTAPSWGPERISAYRPATGSTSIARYDNLAYWAKKYKGEIDSVKMMKLLSTPVAQGGVLKEDTLTQFVYVPAKLELWLRAPGYQDWISVPLKDLFGW